MHLALPALPPLQRVRRFALPAVLLGSALLGLSGLAALPATASPQGLVTASADGAGSLAVLRNDLAPPVVREPVALRRVAPKIVKAAATPSLTRRPLQKRATRSRPAAVAADVRLNTDGYACPVAGPNHFSDTWGEPRSNGRRHEGTDILAAYGTPVAAVTSGIVKTAFSSSGGISLYLEGDDGVEYFYAHNSRNDVSTGQRVRAGEIIGAVGTSGNAPESTPHVHFERHPGKVAVNPYPFVRRVC